MEKLCIHISCDNPRAYKALESVCLEHAGTFIDVNKHGTLGVRNSNIWEIIMRFLMINWNLTSDGLQEHHQLHVFFVAVGNFTRTVVECHR